MPKKFSLEDLRRDTAGMMVVHRPFADELIRNTNEEEALRWFYHQESDGFESKTPYEFILENGHIGKQRVSSALYELLSGQPG